MQRGNVYQKPLFWIAADFDLVFLPGDHEKGGRQMIELKALRQRLAGHMLLTSHDEQSNKKRLSAICHGVQALVTTDKACE